MKVKLGALALLVTVHCAAVGFSVEGKPNFSGTWTLDKDKSDLGSQGQGGGAGRGGGRGGIFGEGIPGLGGGRSGGGSRPGGRGAAGSGMGGFVPTSLVIDHQEPNLIVKKTMIVEGKEQVEELTYTIDGTENINELSLQGMSMKSKTRWEGNRLVTESESDTPMGTMKIKEVRSLSTDGNEMTMEVTRRRGTQKLIYRKQ